MLSGIVHILYGMVLQLANKPRPTNSKGQFVSKDGETKPLIGRPEMYTQKFVREELEKILRKLKKDKDIIYIGSLFEDKNYTRQTFYYMVNKFVDKTNERFDYDIEQIAIKLNEVIEDRVVTYGLKNGNSAAFIKFLLQSKFGYEDKKVIENRTESLELSKKKEKLLDDLARRLLPEPDKQQHLVDVEVIKEMTA